MFHFSLQSYFLFMYVQGGSISSTIISNRVHCALYKMLKIMLCSFLQNKYNKTETGRQSVSVPVSVPVPVPLVTTFLMYKPKYDEKFFSYFKMFFTQYTPQSLKKRPIESNLREKNILI